MAFERVVKHTFWDLEEFDDDHDDFEINLAPRFCRAYTDSCVDYNMWPISEESDPQCAKHLSGLSTVVGSSSANSAGTPTRSCVGSDAGDISDRWADDVLVRPAGIWLPPGCLENVHHAFWPNVMPPADSIISHAARQFADLSAGDHDAVDAQIVSRRSKESQQLKEKTNCIIHHNSTTIVLRGLAKDMPRAKLLEMIDSAGFGSLYDFVYLPREFKKGKGLGYAIINFINHAKAERAYASFMKFTGSVSWCDSIQGLHLLIQRYRDSPVMHSSMPEDYKPLTFVGGESVPFPLPTTTVSPPQ